MKIYLFKSLLFFLALLTISCTSSEDDIEMQNIKESEFHQYELTQSKFSQIFKYNQKLLNESKQKKTTVKGNHSDDVFPISIFPFFLDKIYLAAPVGEEGLNFFVEIPKSVGWDGLKNGEWTMNQIHLKNPKVFIVDFRDGLVKYSNWCEENQTGVMHLRVRSKLIEIDIDGDGEIDLYQIPFYDENTDAQFNLQTMLTDGQNSIPGDFPVEGDCKEATKEVSFRANTKIKNGVKTTSAVLDGEKYEATQTGFSN